MPRSMSSPLVGSGTGVEPAVNVPLEPLLRLLCEDVFLQGAGAQIQSVDCPKPIGRLHQAQLDAEVAKGFDDMREFVASMGAVPVG